MTCNSRFLPILLAKSPEFEWKIAYLKLPGQTINGLVRQTNRH